MTSFVSADWSNFYAPSKVTDPTTVPADQKAKTRWCNFITFRITDQLRSSYLLGTASSCEDQVNVLIFYGCIVVCHASGIQITPQISSFLNCNVTTSIAFGLSEAVSSDLNIGNQSLRSILLQCFLHHVIYVPLGLRQQDQRTETISPMCMKPSVPQNPHS